MQAAEAFYISGHVSRLQAHDLPSALAGLLDKAETVLRPSSKNSRERRLQHGTPAPQKRALVTAIVLLLDRAGELHDQFPETYQAVQAKLLAAFQQHPWLWERLLRVDMHELLGRHHATAVVVEALLLLDGRSQARALTLLRLQLQRMLQRGQEVPVDRTAALQAVLARAFGGLRQCFPVVWHLLPGAPSHSGATTQLPAAEGGRLQVQLCEQLPALLHLVLVLACQDSQAPAEEGTELSNAQRSSRSSTAAACGPAAAAGQQGKGAEQEAGNTRSGGNPYKEGALRYAAVLLQRLSQPEALHDALGLTLCQAAVAWTAPGSTNSTWGAAAGATAAVQSGLHTGCTGKLSNADLLRLLAAQDTMEVLMEALVTLPGVAAAASLACSTPSTDASSQAQACVQVPDGQQQQQQQALQQESDGGGNGNPAEAVSQLVAALLALHWELAKLRVACASEAENKYSKGLGGGHLSQEGCLQLLRLAATEQHVAGPDAQLRGARMPRHTGVGAAVTLPPVQLLLPPSVVSHLLDLIGRAMESPSWTGSQSADAHPAAGSPKKGQAGRLESLSKLAAAVLEIQQACFQGLSQPGLVLHGPLHRQAIAAASKLHSLLTQPPAAGAGAAQAATAAAAAASNMAAQAGLEEDRRGRPMRAAARKRSLPGSFSLAALEGRAQPAKRSRLGAAAPANGAPAAGASGGEAAGGGWQPAGGGRAAGEVANPVADLLQLFGMDAAPEQPQDAGEGNGEPSAAALQQQGHQQQQPQLRSVPAGTPLPGQAALARKRISPQPVVPLLPPLLPQQLALDQIQHQHAPPEAQPPASQGIAAARKRITPASAVAVPPDMKEPGITVEKQQGRGPAHPAMGSGGPLVTEAGMVPTETAEANHTAPASEQSWQQDDGRVHLTGASGLDDAGKEALWAAYIADKELLLELMGDTDYQEWFDEAAHPLPEGVTNARAVDTLLDDVLGSPAGGKLISAAIDVDSELLSKLPPGPGTLLEASLQLPWQAALAACLLLLQRCLVQVLPEDVPGAVVTSGGGSSSRPLGGRTSAALAEVGSSQGEPALAGASIDVPAGMAQLLCGVLGKAQPGEAAKQALAVAMPHYGPLHMDQAIKGITSHPIGGALLTLAMQLRDTTQKYCGLRTSPILLSAYTAVLSCLLPLAQQEAQQLQRAGRACGKGMGRPPLQLLPPIGMQLLGSPRLRPSALLPASVKCLLRLACPTAAPQEAIAWCALLLWALLQPQPLPLLHDQTGLGKAQQGHAGLTGSLLPSWLRLPDVSLPQNLLLRPGLQPAARAAAAAELLLLIGAALQGWEEAGGLEGLARGLLTAAPNQVPQLAAALPGVGTQGPSAAGKGPAPKGRASGKGRRGRGRGKVASAAHAPPSQVVGEGVTATGVLAVASESTRVAAAGGVPAAGMAVQQSCGTGSPSVDSLWPAIDTCCTAVQWLLRNQTEAGQSTEGIHVALLGSDTTLRGLLALSSRLASLCTSALQMLAGSLERPSGTVPYALHDAAVLWALSLELEQWLGEAGTISLPEALVPAQLKLQGAVEELAGAQSSCAELVRGLPEHHPLYPAILAAMEGAPSLLRFSLKEADLSGEESGGRGLPGSSRGGPSGLGDGSISGAAMDSDEVASAAMTVSKGRGCQLKQKGAKGLLHSSKQQHRQQQRQQQEVGQQAHGGRRRRRRRLKDVKNPALRAMIADGGCIAEDLEADDLSDLEDFIVHNPSRDYGRFFAEHFPQARPDSGDEVESDCESGDGQEGAEGLSADRQEQPAQTEQLGTEARAGQLGPEAGTGQQPRSTKNAAEEGGQEVAAAGGFAASAEVAVARGRDGPSQRQGGGCLHQQQQPGQRQEAQARVEAAAAAGQVPGQGRGRPRKQQPPGQRQEAEASNQEAAAAAAAAAAGMQVGHAPRQGRGRPRKQRPPGQLPTAEASIGAAAGGQREAAEVRRGRGRPRKQLPWQQQEPAQQEQPGLDDNPVNVPASSWGRLQQGIPGLAASTAAATPAAEHSSAAGAEPPSADGLVPPCHRGRRSTRTSSQAPDQDRSGQRAASGGRSRSSKARSRSSGSQPKRAGTDTWVELP